MLPNSWPVIDEDILSLAFSKKVMSPDLDGGNAAETLATHE